jgi:hypothetical protein
VANHIELNNVLYQRHNQQHAYTVGNRFCLAIEAAKSIKKIICSTFSSPLTTASIHITNTAGQEKESPAAPQKTEGRPEMTYA